MNDNRFRYLDARGHPHELRAVGLEHYRIAGQSCCSYEFEVNIQAERGPRMSLPLYELKRLHEYLASIISDIEQQYSSNPRLEAQVKAADDYVKNLEPIDFWGGPRVVY